MPWDGTELQVGTVTGDTLDAADAVLVMGGPEESVLAPAWRDDATLYAVSDASGWWNLYQVAAGGGTSRPLHPLDEEFAGPLWQLGGRRRRCAPRTAGRPPPRSAPGAGRWCSG